MVPATLLDDKASNTEKLATFESLTSTERLSTVSSPFLGFITKRLGTEISNNDAITAPFQISQRSSEGVERSKVIC